MLLVKTRNVSRYFSIGSRSMGNSKWRIPEEHSQIRKKMEELDTAQINVKTMKRFFFGKQLTNNIFTNQ